MLVLHPAYTREAAVRADQRQAGSTELAERRFRRRPYLAQHHVSCDYRDGVLILRGCLPTSYLKQVAQEVVAPLEAVEHIDNQIEVVTPAFRSRRG
jgi:osmotically-inducible protein OsmY